MKEGFLTWVLALAKKWLSRSRRSLWLFRRAHLAGTGVLHRNTQAGLTWAARSPSPLPSAMNGLVCLAQWANQIVFYVCYVWRWRRQGISQKEPGASESHGSWTLSADSCMAEPEEGNASLGYWCRQLGELDRGSRSQTAPSAGQAVRDGLGGK